MYRYSRYPNNSLRVDICFDNTEDIGKRIYTATYGGFNQDEEDIVYLLKNNFRAESEYKRVFNDLCLKELETILLDEYNNPKVVVKCRLNDKALQDSLDIDKYPINELVEDDDLQKALKYGVPYGRFIYECYGKHIGLYNNKNFFTSFEGKNHEEVYEWFEK